MPQTNRLVSHEPVDGASPRVDCTVIVITYNSARHIERMLDSLPAAADGLSVRCVAVDNGSRDATRDILSQRNDVELIVSGQNLGYAGGFNSGRARAGDCASLLILNPDLVLEPSSIRRLYEALSGPGVGVAVPMLVNDDGSAYASLRRDPTALRALGDALCGSRFSRRPGWLAETIWDLDRYENRQDVAWAGGAAMLISADCDAAVGQWDEDRFFLYSEETDFAIRARRCGYRIRYVPAARAHHEHGGSGRSPGLAALLAVNRVRLYEKYHGRTASAAFRAAVALHHLLRIWDPEHRLVLAILCRRSRWAELPSRS